MKKSKSKSKSKHKSISNKKSYLKKNNYRICWINMEITNLRLFSQNK